MVNELTRSPTRSNNVYFGTNEQVLIAVFTTVFCFTHAEYNWSVQTVNSVLCKIQRNQSNLLTFKN